MSDVDTTGLSTRVTDPTDTYVIKIPANMWLGIEKINVPPSGPGLQVMQSIVGGNIEHLSILDYSITGREFRQHCVEEGWIIDAWGHDEARFGAVVAMNARASMLLGWPHSIEECLVGDIMLTSYDDDGDTLPLPQGVWEYLTENMSHPIPGLG